MEEKRDEEGENLTCEDCYHCGVVYYVDEPTAGEEFKMACPFGRFFDHPNPKECKNFTPKRG